MRIRSRLTLLFAIVVLVGGLVTGRGASAQAITNQQALVERARLSFDEMIRNPDYPALPDLLRRARAVLIVPEMLKGAFFIGGEGGNGVLLVRQPGEAWSYPAFYTMGSGSLGLQFGGQVGQVVMTIMTERALNAVLAGEVTVGANVRAALVTAGMGLGAATAIDRNADMFAFWDSQGLFAGAAVEGGQTDPVGALRLRELAGYLFPHLHTAFKPASPVEARDQLGFAGNHRLGGAAAGASHGNSWDAAASWCAGGLRRAAVGTLGMRQLSSFSVLFVNAKSSPSGLYPQSKTGRFEV